MRRFITLIIILFIVEASTRAQSCLPEGIEFTTQAQIDSFQVNYPGCSEIEGNVTIQADEIVNLNGLSVVTSISGDLIIEPYNWSNNLLNSLNGLESLTSVGGSLEIMATTNLYSLSGLNNLYSIGDKFSLKFTEGIQNMNGLESLETIGGTFDIYGNHDLTNLTGLQCLNDIEGGLIISFNEFLEDISGLENVNSIGGYLEISHNGWLVSLTGLENIAAASIGQLAISHNSELSDCDIQSICEYLAAPNGVVNIYRNSSGCNNPSEIAAACGIELLCLPYGNYYFLNQSEIDNFQTNYPGCSELIGYVEIGGSNITNLQGLNEVTTIHGNIMINNNDSLTSLSGLNSLNFIEGHLSIGYWEGWSYNHSLTSLNGLEGLDSVGGDLDFIRNPVLVSLAGLTHLISIGGSLSLIENDSLESLAGLNNINPASINWLNIGGNISLSTCEVQSVCDYLANPGGYVDIGNNATGCNSQEEVEAACGVGLDESSVTGRQSSVSIYPNPSTTSITISLPSTTPINNITLSIYNVNSQQVISCCLTVPITFLDISALPCGIYFARITTETTVMVGKFVKR
jgi:hypothetical protein